MNIFKKLTGCLLAVGLTLGINPITAYAASAPVNPAVPAVSNITLVKLEYQNIEAPNVENTGLPITLPTEVRPYDRTKYGDVEFSLYKLNKTSIPNDLDTMTIAKNVEDSVLNSKALPYGAVRQGSPVPVNNDGKAVFTNIASNNDDIYVFVETKAPATVITRSKPMLVQLPITNAQGTGYLSDITLYPKNEVKEIEVAFTKSGLDSEMASPTLLQNALFHLYSGEKGSGTLIKDESGSPLEYRTGKDGKFLISGLRVGKYYLVEQEVPGLIDGMIKDATPYNALPGFKYLVGKDALNDRYNQLGFEVLPNGEVAPDTAYQAGYINYNIPKIEKDIEGYLPIRGFAASPDTPAYDLLQNIPFSVHLSVPYNIKDYSDFKFNDVLEFEGTATNDLRYTGNVAVYLLPEFIEDTEENRIVLTEGQDYKITKDGTNKMTVDFIINGKVSDKISSSVQEINQNYGSMQIVCKYSAEFYGNSIKPGEAYENAVYLTYNNSPNRNTKTRYDESRTEFKTNRAYVRKTDNGLWSSGIVKSGLSGAEFVLIRDMYDPETGISRKEYFAGFDAAIQDPVWKDSGITAEDDIDASTIGKITDDIATNFPDSVFKSDENGIMDIGMFNGRFISYYLLEVKAPEGYRLPLNPVFPIELDDSTSDINNPQIVENLRSPDMPITGTEKTALTVIALSGLLVAALVVGKKRLKKSV